MVRRTYYLLFILLLEFWGVLPGYAFIEKDLRVLNMQDGLADNTIYCIHKDIDGFMWFGTNNGLSRYDGIQVKNFNTGGAYMRVSNISETTDGLLWILADRRLFCFDRHRECFVPVTNARNGTEVSMKCILSQDDSLMWSIRDNTLQMQQRTYIRNSTGQISEITLQDKSDFPNLAAKQTILSAFCLSKDKKTLWLATDKAQLIRMDMLTRKSSELIGTPLNSKQLSVLSIVEDRGCVWILTVAEGLLCYDIHSGQFRQFTYSESGGTENLSHSDVFAFVPFLSHSYLAATWNGYTVLNFDKNNPQKFTTNIYSNTFSQLYRNIETRMISAYYDPQGILWIGTHGGGVIASDLRKQFYRQYIQNRHNEICGMVMDEEKHLWLATFHKGIMRSDEPFGSVDELLQFSPVKDGSVEQKRTVLTALKDSVGNLWFGNADGTLTYYDRKNKEFTIHPLQLADGRSWSSGVWALLIDRSNRFWIGTDSGVLLFDRKTKRCIPVSIRLPNEEREPSVRAIVSSRDGSIWIGTSLGVRRMLSTKDEKPRFLTGYEEKAKIEANGVRSLLASSDGNIYVGYIDGFAIISPQTNRITSYLTTRNGLCNNFVGCITEDAKGRIWLGTNSGISRYSRHQHLFYSYYISGSNRSVMSDGKTLFWGNNRGLTYFNPQEVRNTYSMVGKVMLTNLEVNNRPVTIGEEVNGQVVLNEGISYAKRLELDYENRNFALSFSDLPYSEGAQKYSYRLLPYQKEWIVANEGEKIAYTNLPKGDYLFEVKSLFPEEDLPKEGEEITTLPIVIHPHWSETIGFRMSIFLLGLAVLYYLFDLMKRKRLRMEHEMRLEHELQAATQEREREKQVREERENFFTTAAHELRTPLTLILSPLQEVLHSVRTTDAMREKLSITYRNACSLHSLVDHLLYVQKIEAGMVKLQLSETDIVELIRSISVGFSQMAETEQIKFSVDVGSNPLSLWMDKDKIVSAVRNLLSNAFKYTSAGGSIGVSLQRKEIDGKKFCLLSVTDTGVGIPEQMQERIFESFVTGDNVPTVSSKMGIGLYIVKNTMNLHHGRITLHSVPGEGSLFTLYIPEGKEHFRDDTYDIVTSESPNEAMTDLPLVSGSPEESISMQRKHTLLLVEDNNEMRAYLRSLFRQRYFVIEAMNGEEGVRMATEKIPDLIISDVMMPVMDGFACCRIIREQLATAQIPIIMLTAKAEDADVLQGSKMGADDYMMKPFNSEILKVRVENLITQRERLKQIYTKSLMLKHVPEPKEAGKEEDSFMLKVIGIIELNLSNEAFNVNMLAEMLSMSQTTLYRKMKQRSDLSVIEVIRSIRMSKAAALVIENKYSIQEIAEMVGFNDLTTFRQHFTKQFGAPPSKYASTLASSY